MCTAIPDLVPVKKALISVSDKTDLLVLAAALKEIGVEVRIYLFAASRRISVWC
jgi:hypothetical protein